MRCMCAASIPATRPFPPTSSTKLFNDYISDENKAAMDRCKEELSEHCLDYMSDILGVITTWATRRDWNIVCRKGDCKTGCSMCANWEHKLSSNLHGILACLVIHCDHTKLIKDVMYITVAKQLHDFVMLMKNPVQAMSLLHLEVVEAVSKLCTDWCNPKPPADMEQHDTDTACAVTLTAIDLYGVDSVIKGMALRRVPRDDLVHQVDQVELRSNRSSLPACGCGRSYDEDDQGGTCQSGDERLDCIDVHYVVDGQG